MKLLKISIFIVLSLMLAIACNTKNVKKDGESKKGDTHKQVATIESGEHYEECIELYPNQVLHYSFNASQNVDFNIHYHGMEGRMYAIKKNNISSYKGDLVCSEMDFYSKDQEFFCMIWTNLNESSARLDLRYSVSTSEAPVK